MPVIKKGKKDKNKGGKAMSDADIKKLFKGAASFLPLGYSPKDAAELAKHLPFDDKTIAKLKNDPLSIPDLRAAIVAREDKSDAKETAIKRRIPGKKTGGKVKKRKGYKLGAKVERAEKDPRDGYGYNRAYYGNQRRPKTL
tara:strand:- start:639 stop:1061 length:423 start_codon:yes stop_codon:yes gene_type:complete